MEIWMLGDSWTPQPRAHCRWYREETCWGMIKSTFYHTIFPTDVRIFVPSTTDKNRWRCGLKPEADRCVGEARHFSSILPNRHHRNTATKEPHQLPYSSWNVTRLSVQYLQNAAEDQHALRQRFYDYKFQPGHDVMAHIMAIETMATHLNDAGAAMDPIQLMTKVVCTRTFENFL